MDGEYLVERVTLWDMLCQPSLTLQLSRFALFLFAALIIMIVLDCRKLSQACSFPTVMLLLLTGLLGIYSHYWVTTASICINTRMYIQPWYYPVCILTAISLTVVFFCGGVSLVRGGRMKSMIVRSQVYCFALYFAFTAALTPTRVNHCLAKLDWPEKAVPENVGQIDFRDTLMPFFFNDF